MKNLIYAAVISFASLVVLTRCNEKGFPEASYPRVATLPVTDVSPEGASFHAKTIQQGTSEVVTRGFVWGTDEGVTMASGEMIDIGPGDGDFDARVNFGLVSGTTYHVKAFVKTKDILVYSPLVSFVSDGSFPPSIASISPTTASFYDTVTIQGTRFSYVPGNNKVMFGEINARVVKSTESMIQCLVPIELRNNPVPITVKVGSGTTRSTEFFTLLAPSIAAFSPAEATFGDLLTITGSNFAPSIYDNQVSIGTHRAVVYSASSEEIVVTVPSDIRTKDNVISVVMGGYKAEAAATLRIAGPVITSLSVTKVKSGDVVTITGKNFNPEPGASRVRLAGFEASVQNVTTTSIQFEIPVVTYEGRSLYPEVTVTEQTAVSLQELQLQEPVIGRAEIPEGVLRSDAVAFTINENAYVGLGNYDSDDIWRYSPSTNSWTEVAPFPGGWRVGGVAFAIGNYGYVGLGREGMTDFWRYDPSLNNWTAISNFPQNCRNCVGLSGNGKGYVAISDDSDNFWEYNPASNTWTKKADCPTLTIADGGPVAGFTIGNDLYVYMSDVTGTEDVVSRYNTISNSWSIVDSPNDLNTQNRYQGFAVKGKGYIKTAYTTYEYEPSSNNWRMIDHLNLVPSNNNSVAVDVNNKAYIGFGDHYGWWEFDPLYE